MRSRHLRTAVCEEIRDMEPVLYFDICAVPIFIIILCTAAFRKMTKGRSNKLFLLLLACAFIADAWELLDRLAYITYPIGPEGQMWSKICEYFYFISRNGVNAVYIFYVISITKTWYRIKAWWRKLLLFLPYGGILFMLITNEFTGAVFTVSETSGYIRGSNIILVYVFAMCYMVFGTGYLLFHRYTLDRGSWWALMSMYLVNLAVVGVQYLFSFLLLESFATSLTLLFIVLFMQRPERQVDLTTGLPGYRAFCGEMAKIQATGQEVQVVILSITNAEEMASFLKDSFYTYIHATEEQVRLFARRERVAAEIYFEQPGNFYFILEDTSYNPVQAIPEIRDSVRRAGESILKTGARPDARIVTVHFPAEIDTVDELLRFGHNFPRFVDYNKIFTRASAVISDRTYRIEAHMDEILDRAVKSGGLKVRYQPIRDVRTGSFDSAEAVIELSDEVYGDIDADLLISAAEESGLIVRLGESVLEEAFSHASRDELSRAGLSRMYIRMSVNQVMQMDLTDTIWRLREKYRVDPEQIGFGIKESAYENMSSVFDENLRKLSMQGYTIVLDGFGRGYSNLRHLLDMPIKAVRLDRSIVATVSDERGKALFKGTVSMLRSIPLEVMAQGADDEETAQLLCDAGCDIIQGSYYAVPAAMSELISRNSRNV